MSDAVPTLDLGPADRVEGKPRFAPGTTVHNFRIIRELGAGGMGIVLEARDPELDRNVAIKIVRDHDASSTAGGRLIREAQAMARLDHPNVIGVFEVGTIDDQVFIVMELVRGDTLATWLEQPRSWRAIVGVFVQAGEGLLAAHDAGLVHRDFKPGNAMLDAEGRVRIGDFGLARTYEPDVDHGSNQSTGAGTPGYMAPEQAAGLEVDARADQYSFAVSLREALGKTRAPRRIRAAIARASSPEANDRYPSLAPLLVELRRSLQRRGRAVLLLAACVATVGVTVALVHQPAAATCDESARLIDGVWSGPMRSAVIANFAMRRPTAQIASTTKLVDEWSASWQLARHAACAADVAQREPRLRCSDQMLLLVQAQIAAWITTDATGVDRSIEAAAALPPASLCAKLETQPVVNPELARELATTEVALHAGHAVSLVPRVDALIATAQRPENADARAQVLLVVGRIERESGALDKAHDHLGRAAHEAGRAHDDKTLFDALLEQSATIADQGRPLDALGLLDAADAVAARIGLDEAGRISEQRGVMLTDAGRTVEAIAVLEKLTAQQHAREQSTTAAIAYAASSGALASAYAQHEDFGKARDVLLRVLAIEEPLYGPTHPDIGRTLADLGTDENHAGMYDAAAGHLRRAREILVQAYGEKSSPVATVDLTRAHAAIDQNDPATAQPLLEHAREIFTLVLPPDHPTLAVVEDDLGTLLRNADKCGDAVPHFRHSVAIAERAGQHGIGLANKLVNLAACLSDTGDTAGARPALVTALAELDVEHADDALRREPWAILADVEWHDGHRKEAVALATKVIASIPDGAPAEALALRTYERDQLAAWR